MRRAFLTDPVFGKTAEERQKTWERGGLTIRTTLDPKAQESVQAAIENGVYKDDEVATAVALVEPGTGKITGMGQSRPYGYGKNETEMNLSVNASMGGGAATSPAPPSSPSWPPPPWNAACR